MTEEIDDCGLPVHLMIPVNAQGQGPLPESWIDKDTTWVCWCGDQSCPGPPDGRRSHDE